MNKLMTTIITMLVLVLLAPAAHSTMTIATFADPAQNSSTPLFVVDLMSDLITGGWTSTGLDLLVLNSVNYPDAVFVMSDIAITNVTDPFLGYKTDSGTITFFESGQTTEIITIEFESGWVNFFGFGGADFASDDVTISGPALGSMILAEESFAFSFTNYVPLQGSYRNGFTTTASFTSSAIPEPATIAMLGVGCLALLRKRKNTL